MSQEFKGTHWLHSYFAPPSVCELFKQFYQPVQLVTSMGAPSVYSGGHRRWECGQELRTDSRGGEKSYRSIRVIRVQFGIRPSSCIHTAAALI